MGEESGLVIGTVIITDLNSNSPDIFLDPQEFFDINGRWIQPTFEINAGLYKIGVVRGTKYRSFIYEATGNQRISNELSNFLHPKIMPVPITGSEFQLDLVADATMNFTYYLVDMQGTQLYSKRYSMRKGEHITDNIRPDKAMNRGILFNRFVLEDESVIVVEAVKE
jgi:hypothetical protein